MLPPTERQVSKAIKIAIEDRKIPSTPSERVTWGKGISTEFGLYWPREEKLAVFRRRDDLTFFLSYADPIAANSYLGRELRPWANK